MADGLPPDSQAAIASSCGEAPPEGAAGAAAARARARLRAFARALTAFSCFTSLTALWRFRRVSVCISCFEADVPATGVTAALVSLSLVAAKATAGTAAAEAASAGTRTFLTEDLLRRVRCALLTQRPP